MTLNQKSRGLACCLALAVSAASATDRLVPGTFANVQAAIDACAASGDRVLIGTAGTYAGTTTIPGKVDVSINIGFASGVQATKNVNIEGGVAGVVLTGTVKVEKTSTVTLTNLTVTNATKGIVCNDTDTPYPSDFSCVNLVGTTVTACTDESIRLNGSNILSLTNSACLNPVNRNITVDGNGNYCTINLTNSKVNGSVNSAGLRLHRQTNVTGTNSQIKDNKEFGIFVDSFGETGTGDAINLTNCDVSGNQARNLFFARSASGTMSGCTFTGFAGSNELLFQYGGLPYNLTFTNCTIDQSLGNGVAVNAVDNGGTLSTYVFNQCVLKGGTTGVVHFDNESDVAARWITVNANRTTFRSSASVVKDDFSGTNLDLEDTKATLVNCVIDEGTSGIVVRNGNQLKAHQCTIVSRAGLTTGGIEIRDQRVGSSASEIRGSLVDGPRIGVAVGPGLTPVIDHNLVNGTVAPFVGFTAGLTNPSGLPVFVTASTGPGTGNFHLQNTSAAISKSVAGLSVTDYDGGVRPLPALSTPDAGAYENITGGAASVSNWTRFN